MYTIQTLSVIGSLVLTALAVPQASIGALGSANANVRASTGSNMPTTTSGGMNTVPRPSINASGTGNANVQFTAGGGILPTFTFGGMMAGGNNEFGLGLSNTIGIGGRILPTVQIGGGGAFAVNPSDVLGQIAGGFSEGGWLAGLVPTFSVMGSLNNEAYFKPTSGLNVGGGMNGGMVGSLGYGGNFIDASSLMVSAGGNFAADIHNGAASPTSTSASQASSSASPASSSASQASSSPTSAAPASSASSTS